MKVHRSADFVYVDLTGAEAKVLLDELENVRGGARLPKLRQLCEKLAGSFALSVIMAPKHGGRPKMKERVMRPIPSSSEVDMSTYIAPDAEGDGESA